MENVLPLHVAPWLSHMKLLDAPLDLLLNFHEPLLKSGLRRLTRHRADQS